MLTAGPNECAVPSIAGDDLSKTYVSAGWAYFSWLTSIGHHVLIEQVVGEPSLPLYRGWHHPCDLYTSGCSIVGQKGREKECIGT